MQVIKGAQRKSSENTTNLAETVRDIIEQIKTGGDTALKSLSERFDGVSLAHLCVSEETVKTAYDKVDSRVVKAFREAAEQIRFYAEKQMACLLPLETSSRVPGVTLGHRHVPVDACGVYIPGGRYPLFSTALMLAIPAKVAGVKRVVACSPASRMHGGIHPAALVAMDIAGVDEIYCAGGAQAVAAMAYGTQSIAKVDMIVGPGNKYVTEAKRQVIGTTGIDSLAGPSEVLIIADDDANVDFIAIDILAQCEHDPDARAILLTDSRALADAVVARVVQMAKDMPTGDTALVAWENNSEVILVDDMDEAVRIADEIAPEHLEVHTRDCLSLSQRLHHYGSLFIGEYAPVTFGDFCSGTNHTLPTMGTARFSNGVWVGTFLKTSFHQYITKEGCKNLAETGMRMAEAEGLFAHKRSVELRVEAD